jgi:predicted transport protein
MKHSILKDNEKYSKQEYEHEDDLTDLFAKNYANIISDKSFFIKAEKQLKSKSFKNFKESIPDGFLLVWDYPSTPSLYITEMELGEKHNINTHILPQLGDFISFIQSSKLEERNALRDFLYSEIKKNKLTFDKIRKDTEKEVLDLLNNSMEDLQILLVIDRIPPQLSTGLSQIEKAINVKIRKIEVSLFTKDTDKLVLFSDSEVADEKELIEEETSEETLRPDEWSLEYHLKNKPENISSMFNTFLNNVKAKGIEESPTKFYIGFFKNNNMIFSCVVRKNSLIFYSKVKIDEIKTDNYHIPFRDVRTIGHYTNHLPTEIVITEIEQIEDLIRYFDEVSKKY